MQNRASAGSKPIHSVKLDRDVAIEMRDGVRLVADVYRPAAPGQFPALLTMHPYCKDMEDLVFLGPVIDAFNVEFAAVEAGDHEFWATHGYAHAIVDVRGTGKSQGEYHNLCSPLEQQDGYDLVEWLAEEPWCDGNVGMIGISYLAIIQYLVAAQRPPHLRAIFPQDGWADLYRDIMYHGGIPGVFAYVMDQIIPTRSGVPASRALYGEEEMTRRAAAVKADPATSVGRNATAYKVLTLPDVHPIAFDITLNRTDGPFYRERSPVTFMNRIQVPTYLGSEMHAYPVTMHLPGVSRGWEEIPAPKKVAFRPSRPGGLNRPFHELHDEILRWYDHWLKGIDTGIMDEPPVKIWVRGAEEWRYAEEWPLLTVTDWRRLYLRSGNRLTWGEPPSSPEDPDVMVYEPPIPSVINPHPFNDPPPSISYETGPFERDTDIIGPLALYLHASLSAEDGDFLVAVKDVDPGGDEFILTRGWLRASHRAVDTAKSLPWRPYHPHEQPEFVTPAAVHEFAIEIQPIANRFGAGHRLKVEVWPCDYPVEEYYDWTQYWGACHHIPYGKPVDYALVHTDVHQSFLLVPVIADAPAGAD